MKKSPVIREESRCSPSRKSGESASRDDSLVGETRIEKMCEIIDASRLEGMALLQSE